jgi:ankyrin repeat protein
MLETIIYYVQSNSFHKDTIPILFTNKSFYNNHALWSMIINNRRNITPLMCAAFNINYIRIKFLLDSGANPNMVDSSNQSALLYTLTKIKSIPNKCTDCESCNLKITNIIKIITELCKHNANLNIYTESNDNIVMIATRLCFTEAVKIFCNYNFNINHKNIDGKTAMSLAIENNCPIISYYLWKKGGNINSIDDKKHTFLMSLSSNYNKSVTSDMIEEVLKNKPNINALDHDNADALLHACMSSSIQIMEILIKYGANIGNALMYAIFKNNIDYINILCTSKHAINYDIMIKYAKKLKYVEIEKLLIKKSNLLPTHQ